MEAPASELGRELQRLAPVLAGDQALDLANQPLVHDLELRLTLRPGPLLVVGKPHAWCVVLVPCHVREVRMVGHSALIAYTDVTKSGPEPELRATLVSR